MAEYKLAPETLVRLRKRSLISGAPLALIAAAVGIGIGSSGGGQFTYWALAIAIPLSILSLTFGFLRGLKRQKQSWASYRLYLDGNRLRRVEEGLPEVEITSNEIDRIWEREGHGLTVQAESPRRRIPIPATLENFPEVRSQLAAWHPFETVTDGKARMNLSVGPLAGLATIAAFYITFSSTDPRVVVGVGSLLALGLLACMVAGLRSREIPVKTKRLFWVVLLVLFPIAERVWIALHGFKV